MAKPTRPPTHVAVDTNVPLDLAIERELVIDALDTIRRRTSTRLILVPPSVAEELAFIADRGEIPADRDAANHFLRNHRDWGFQLVNYVPFGHEFIARIAERVLDHGLLPEEEVHDAFILVESALLGCSMLLTSDEHLRGINFQRLTFELQAFDVIAPVIATPREIVAKFF
jgi:predicted nucleic acid-binding protein